MPKALRGSFDQALRPLPSVVKASNAKEEGVGGTRALAHSIITITQCLCLAYRVSMSASLDRTSSTVPDEECSRMLQDLTKTSERQR